MRTNFTGKFTGNYLLFYYILLLLCRSLSALLDCIIGNYKCVLICLNITILVPLRVLEGTNGDFHCSSLFFYPHYSLEMSSLAERID